MPLQAFGVAYGETEASSKPPDVDAEALADFLETGGEPKDPVPVLEDCSTESVKSFVRAMCSADIKQAEEGAKEKAALAVLESMGRQNPQEPGAGGGSDQEDGEEEEWLPGADGGSDEEDGEGESDQESGEGRGESSESGEEDEEWLPSADDGSDGETRDSSRDSGSGSEAEGGDSEMDESVE